MSQSSRLSRYSKISPALKFYFIQNLYWRDMSIKEAAQRCNLNYSTGKIILNTLSHQEKTYINNLKRKKRRSRDDGDFPEVRCGFKCIDVQDLCEDGRIKKVQILSRVGFNYFQKKKGKKSENNTNELNTIDDQ